MGLRFDPIGGGQFKAAVQQIIEAETQPLRALEARKAKETSRLKLFQEFKTRFVGMDKALNEISTINKFRELKVDLGDGEGSVSVTLNKDLAEPGQYQIEIEQLAGRTSSISNGIENPTEPLMGIGFVAMDLQDGESVEIYIDDEHSSLNGIANIINRQKGSPVQAAVIKDDAEPDHPWKLLLTGKKDGELNQIDFPEFYFMDGAVDFFVDDDIESRNAEITIDGFEIDLESNDTAEFLPGVNLHIKQTTPDHPFTLTISEDYQKISGKVKELVDQVNGILQFISKQNTIDQNTDTTTTFAGDTSLQSIEYQLRNIMHGGYPSVESESGREITLHMSALGIEFDKSGQLSFKEEKFNQLLEKDFDAIALSITGPSGFAQRLRHVLNNYSRSGSGILSIKEQAIQSKIKNMDHQIDQKARVIERKTQDTVAKFARLESTLGGMQRQQQYLSATLPGAAAGSPISQLLG